MALRFGSMADIAMESEGKAAGGRAVQWRLILWLSVLWDSGIFCSVLAPFGIFYTSAPLGTYQFHQNTLAEGGYWSLHTTIHIQKRDGICLQNLPPRWNLGEMRKSHNCGILHNVCFSVLRIFLEFCHAYARVSERIFMAYNKKNHTTSALFSCLLCQTNLCQYNNQRMHQGRKICSGW
jgi:hypothetical protein